MKILYAKKKMPSLMEPEKCYGVERSLNPCQKYTEKKTKLVDKLIFKLSFRKLVEKSFMKSLLCSLCN